MHRFETEESLCSRLNCSRWMGGAEEPEKARSTSERLILTPLHVHWKIKWLYRPSIITQAALETSWTEAKINTAKVCLCRRSKSIWSWPCARRFILSSLECWCFIMFSLSLRGPPQLFVGPAMNQRINSLSVLGHYIVCLTYMSFICSRNCAAGGSSPDVDRVWGGQNLPPSAKLSQLRVGVSKNLSAGYYQHIGGLIIISPPATGTSTITPKSVTTFG